MYKYPELTRDDPAHVLGLLGSLWTLYYGGRAPLLALVQANLELIKQSKQNLDEAAACASRFTVPLAHTEVWTLFQLKGSECTEKSFPAPPGLLSMPVMMNRMTDATLMLQEGIDYRLNANRLEFAKDPFEDDRIPQMDDTVYLWGFRGLFNRKYVDRSISHAMNVVISDATQKRYRDTTNAITNCAVGGTTITNLTAVLATYLDIPLADGEEVIEGVGEDRRGRFLMTSRHIRRMTPETVVSLKTGSQPPAGTPLFDCFRILDDSELPTTNSSQISSKLVVELASPLVTDELQAILHRVVPPQIGLAFVSPEE